MRQVAACSMAVIFAVLTWFDFCRAEDFASLGYREDTIIESGERQCAGALVYNHDFSFENAYCWQYDGVQLPYYGALAEAFDLGPCNVECAVYWFTNLYDIPIPIDVYVWDGGVDGPPGGVLCMLPQVGDLEVGFWPTCCDNYIEINCCASADFAVGYWVDFSSGYCLEYCCADESGDRGNPWTCIAPGIGYPSGWQHPRVIYPNCVSMGIGVTVTEAPSPARSETWGAIKALF